jgi:FkbM family methyltransferase
MGRLLNKLATLVDPETAVVAHVGAHRGQEVPAYRALGFQRVVLIEPHPALAREARVALAEHHAGKGYRVIEAAATWGPHSAPVTLHVTHNTQMSSLLRPLAVPVGGHFTVRGAPLALLVPDATVAVVDVQGAELRVMAGAPAGLQVAVLETRTVPEYEDGPLHDEVIQTMAEHGWEPVWSRAHARPEVSDVVFRRAA